MPNELTTPPDTSASGERSATPSELSRLPSPGPVYRALATVGLLSTAAFIGVMLWAERIPREDWKWAVGGMILALQPIDLIGRVSLLAARKLPGGSK